MDASGTVAGAIVFSRWRGRNYVRRHAVPSNPRTGLQVGVRSAFKFLSQWWKTFSPTEAGKWDSVGNVTRVTGLNAFISENIRRIREGRPFQFDPTSEIVLPCDDAATLTAGALARAVALSWTYASPTVVPWGSFLYMSSTYPYTQSIAYLINASPAATLQLIVTGLNPGTSYYFKLVTFAFENFISTTVASTTGTPTA
jgi:hypothetical protein